MPDPKAEDRFAPVHQLRRSSSTPAVDASAEAFLTKVAPALPQPPMALRLSLVALCLAQLALVLPWLVGSDPFDLLGDSSAHVARDGSFGVVVAVAGLLAAWRPRWAVPAFVVASIALIAQTVAGVVDSSAQDVANEYVHLPAVVITCLIGLCGVRLSKLGPRR